MFTVLGTKHFINSGFFTLCTKGKQKPNGFSTTVSIYIEGCLLSRKGMPKIEL